MHKDFAFPHAMTTTSFLTALPKNICPETTKKSFPKIGRTESHHMKNNSQNEYSSCTPIPSPSPVGTTATSKQAVLPAPNPYFPKAFRSGSASWSRSSSQWRGRASFTPDFPIKSQLRHLFRNYLISKYKFIIPSFLKNIKNQLNKCFV